MKKRTLEYVIKSFAIIGLFVAVFFIAKGLGWPALFDSHAKLDNDFRIEAWLCLVLYRTLMYFAFPFMIAVIEKIRRKQKFWSLVIRNFNIQFFIYALISGIYLLVGLDKLLGVEIFQSSDALMFLASFAFTLFLGRQLDNSPKINSEGEKD